MITLVQVRRYIIQWSAKKRDHANTLSLEWIYGVWKDGLLVGWRSQTQFYWEPWFKEIYYSLDSVVRPTILSSTKRFAQAWQSSNVDNDIPKGFDLTPYPLMNHSDSSRYIWVITIALL